MWRRSTCVWGCEWVVGGHEPGTWRADTRCQNHLDESTSVLGMGEALVGGIRRLGQRCRNSAGLGERQRTPLTPAPTIGAFVGGRPTGEDRAYTVQHGVSTCMCMSE
jgi:hypothetical protein